MLAKSEIKINLLNMEKSYQLITSTEDFTTLKEVLEKNIPSKIVTGKTNHSQALKESEDFMKSTFKLHKIFYADTHEAENIIPEEDCSETDLLREYNRLGKKIDAYKLPIKILDKDPWFGNISCLFLLFKDISLLSQEKVIYNFITLSNKVTKITGRVISHEITHSQIDSNKGATRYYQNYEFLPRFIELIHKTPDEDADFFTNILLMIQEHSILEQINYFKINRFFECLTLEQKEKYIECSSYLISTLKALHLYEIYLNEGVSKQQEIIKQIQKIFDGEMPVENLLNNNNISIEKGIESAKRLVKETKNKLIQK